MRKFMYRHIINSISFWQEILFNIKIITPLYVLTYQYCAEFSARIRREIIFYFSILLLFQYTDFNFIIYFLLLTFANSLNQYRLNHIFIYQIIYMTLKLLLLISVLLLSASGYENPPQPFFQINGDYVADQIGSASINRPFTINVNNPQISIQGCNNLGSTFVYDSSTQRIRFQQFSSTRRFCPNDQDSLIKNALDSARSVSFNGQNLVFNDLNGNQLFRVRPSGSSTQSPIVPQDFNNGFQPQGSFVPQDQSNTAGFQPQDTQPNFHTLPPFSGQSSSIQGQYDLTVPAIPCSIDRSSHRIQGCNSHTINIQTSSDGSFIFTPTTSTRRACQRDFDKEYLKAYSMGRYLQSTGSNGYRVLDQNRRTLLEINQSPAKSYLLSLPSVRLNVDDQGFIFEGCNINTLEYTLNQQNIQFGQTTSTSRICLSHDYDQLIADTIRAASTYQLSNQGLVLLTNNAPIIIAIIRGVNGPTAAVINFPQYPTYPVVVPAPLYPNSFNYGYPVPTVSLPGVTSVSLKGTYTFNPQSSQLSSITIKFDDEYLQFEGCNIHRLPYAAYTDGVFCLLQGGSSTERDCTLDQDNGILNFIRSISRFTRAEDGYNLYSYQAQIASLVTKVRNQIVRYSVINGGYRFEIPGIDVTVSESTIVIQGCNTVSIPYSLYRDGKISFGNAASSLVFCNRDTDQYYAQSITRAVSIKQSADGFILYDQTGAQTIRFISYFGNQQKFNGKFKLQLPSAGIRLKVSDGVFSLSGCNQFNFKFTLADNGNIQFGGITSTKTTCPTDIDNAFLYTLLKAQSIQVVGNSIVFKNGNGLQIARANNFDLNDNQSPPIYVDPKSPVVPLRQFSFPEGAYRLNLVRSSIKALSASVNRGVLTVSGCNTHNFNINAYSNGNVTFTLGGSTRRYCQQDYDSFFLEAFNQVIKYDSTKGVYTFYDSKKSLLQLTAQSADLSVLSNQIPVGPESFISLKGRYRFQIPRVGLEIIDGSFVFKGKCQHRVPCTYKNTNIFFGNPISSSNCAGIKDDKYFLNMIPQILTFQRQNNQFTFFNSRLQSLFNAGGVSVPTKNVDVIPGLSSGSYEANFPTVDVEFDDKNIFFNRCTKSGLGYRASSQGVFNFSGDARPCSNDYFDSFKNAFEGANKYIRSENGFILQDDSGNQRGRCIKY